MSQQNAQQPSNQLAHQPAPKGGPNSTGSKKPDLPNLLTKQQPQILFTGGTPGHQQIQQTPATALVNSIFTFQQTPGKGLTAGADQEGAGLLPPQTQGMLAPSPKPPQQAHRLNYSTSLAQQALSPQTLAHLAKPEAGADSIDVRGNPKIFNFKDAMATTPQPSLPNMDAIQRAAQSPSQQVAALQQSLAAAAANQQRDSTIATKRKEKQAQKSLTKVEKHSSNSLPYMPSNKQDQVETAPAPLMAHQMTFVPHISSAKSEVADHLNVPLKVERTVSKNGLSDQSANEPEVDVDDSDSISGPNDSQSFGADKEKKGQVQFNGAEILHASGFNLGNYTSEDMASLTQITHEMNRRMEMARGMKRGRKVQGFAEYCQKTTERINELKSLLSNDKTSEDKKKQLRNQISAFQARLKQRITNMDQELRLEQKNQQLSTVLSIVSEYVDHSQLGNIFVKIDESFPEMDFYNCTAYKTAFPNAKKATTRKPAKARKQTAAAGGKKQPPASGSGGNKTSEEKAPRGGKNTD